MSVLGRIESFIFTTRGLVFFPLVGLLWLVKSGIWFMPSLKRTAEGASGDQEKLSVTLLHSLGFDSLQAFFVVYGAFAIGFLFVSVVLLYRACRENSRSAILLFLLFPVSYTSTFWVGPDSFVLFLLASILLVRDRWFVVLPLSAILGMEHFEVGVFVFAGLLLASLVSRESPSDFRVKAFLLTTGAGLAAGKVLGAAFLQQGVLSSQKLSYWLDNWNPILEQLLLRPHLVIWGSLGVGWFLFLRLLDFPDLRMCLGAGLLPSFAVLLLVEDQTRIFALTSFPVLMLYALMRPDFVNQIGRLWTTGMAVAWALVPTTWVWAGHPKWSVFPYDLGLLLDAIWPQLDLPVSTHWPFL